LDFGNNGSDGWKQTPSLLALLDPTNQSSTWPEATVVFVQSEIHLL